MSSPEFDEIMMLDYITVGARWADPVQSWLKALAQGGLWTLPPESLDSKWANPDLYHLGKLC